MDVPELPDDKNTVLILAGDIGLAKRATTYKYFIEDLFFRFKDVVMILGNHEHYNGKFPTSYEKIWTELITFENVFVLEKESIWDTVDDYAIIGATMWTSMDGHNSLTMQSAAYTMNDYSCIRNGPKNEPWKRKLSPRDTVEDFVNAKHYIFEEIKKHKDLGRKVVVVTHHSPCFQSVPEYFKGDDMNGAYCTELFEEIMDLEDAQPDVWCHGHLHNSSNYMIGNTRVMCNPRGYAPNDLNPEFNPELVFEL
jgi:predicted phosphohydrolase